MLLADGDTVLRKWIYLATLTVPGGAQAANQTSQTPLFSERKFKGEGHRPSQSYTLWVENLLSTVVERRQEAEEMVSRGIRKHLKVVGRVLWSTNRVSEKPSSSRPYSSGYSRIMTTELPSRSRVKC